MTGMLQALACVGSTNDEMRERLLAGAPSGSAVWATQQTAGRGRLGRTWFSPPDLNLYLSVGVRLVGPLARSVADRLPLAAGVAAAAAIERNVPVSIGLKWPNDLEIGGRKLGGILCEGITAGGEIDAVVIGVGVNVNTPTDGFPAELADRATSLRAITGRDWAIDLLARELWSEVLHAATALLDGGSSGVITTFGKRDALRGRPVRYTSSSNPRAGIADGVDPSGRLRVLDPDGTVTLVSAGEVELIR